MEPTCRGLGRWNLPYIVCGTARGPDNDLSARRSPPRHMGAAKERGTSEAEMIRTAVRHELLGAPPGRTERARRRARLLAALGTSVYPTGYLDELRAGWGS